MSVDIKSLIKQAHSGTMEAIPRVSSDPPPGQPVSADKRKSPEPKKRPKAKTNRQNDGVKNDLVARIKSVNESEEPYVHLVHIKLKRSTHQKMLLCGLGGIRIQELAAFAIGQLMDSGEMVELINRIKNDMD